MGIEKQVPKWKKELIEEQLKIFIGGVEEVMGLLEGNPTSTSCDVAISWIMFVAEARRQEERAQKAWEIGYTNLHEEEKYLFLESVLGGRGWKETSKSLVNTIFRRLPKEVQERVIEETPEIVFGDVTVSDEEKTFCFIEKIEGFLSE